MMKELKCTGRGSRREIGFRREKWIHSLTLASFLHSMSCFPPPSFSVHFSKPSILPLKNAVSHHTCDTHIYILITHACRPPPVISPISHFPGCWDQSAGQNQPKGGRVWLGSGFKGMRGMRWLVTLHLQRGSRER